MVKIINFWKVEIGRKLAAEWLKFCGCFFSAKNKGNHKFLKRNDWEEIAAKRRTFFRLVFWLNFRRKKNPSWGKYIYILQQVLLTVIATFNGALIRKRSAFPSSCITWKGNLYKYFLLYLLFPLLVSFQKMIVLRFYLNKLV